MTYEQFASIALRNLASDLAKHYLSGEPVPTQLAQDYRDLTTVERARVDDLVAEILAPQVSLCPVCRRPQEPHCGCEFGRGGHLSRIPTHEDREPNARPVGQAIALAFGLMILVAIVAWATQLIEAANDRANGELRREIAAGRWAR